MWGADVYLIRNLLDACFGDKIVAKIAKAVKEDVDVRR
jgi:hypothetical protein